jgi:hypothetical protein
MPKVSAKIAQNIMSETFNRGFGNSYHFVSPNCTKNCANELKSRGCGYLFFRPEKGLKISNGEKIYLQVKFFSDQFHKGDASAGLQALKHFLNGERLLEFGALLVQGMHNDFRVAAIQIDQIFIGSFGGDPKRLELFVREMFQVIRQVG